MSSAAPTSPAFQEDSLDSFRLEESALARWGRRLLSISLYLILFAVTTAAVPVLLPIAWLVDRFRGRSAVLARCVAFLPCYFMFAVAGLLGCFGTLALSGIWAGASQTRFLAWNFALQRWWAGMILSSGARVFDLRFVVENDEVTREGPFLLFLRHASMLDTLLPIVLISRPYRIMPRYVLKRELLWEPCLDIVGNRLPNVFVYRGSTDSERDVRAVQALGRDLGPTATVILYPEGTRFTPEKRRRILEKIREGGDPGRLEQAEVFRYVLPPRLGGALGLLDANPTADVVFCAHVGLEGGRTVREFFRGNLIGKTVHVAFWRVRREEIPETREERVEWLYREWKKVDEWVGRHQENGDEPRT